MSSGIVKVKKDRASATAKVASTPVVSKGLRFDAGWTYPVVCAALFLLFFLRRPAALLYPTLYFEDGTIFYHDQLLSDSITTVFKPYHGGYYLLVPRVVSLLACLMPARIAPYLVNLTGLAVGAAAAGAFCATRFRCIIRSDALRTALCVLFAAALDSTEMLATSSNCFWLLGIPIILMTVLPPAVPQGAKRWIHLTFLTGGALLGLMTPLVALAVPLALWQVYSKRSVNRWQFPAGLLLAMIVQVVSYRVGAFRPEHNELPLDAVATALLVATAHRVVMSSMLGFINAMQASGKGIVWIPLLSLAFLQSIVFFLLFRGDRFLRYKTALCIYVLTAGVFLSVVGKGFVPHFQQIAVTVEYGGPRYYFISSCAFAVLVALAIERSVAEFGRYGVWKIRRNSVREGTMVLILAITFASGIYGNFRSEGGRDFRWQSYAPRIDAWRQDLKLGRSSASVTIPINLPPWSIVLPRLPGPNDRLSSGFEEGSAAVNGVLGGVSRASAAATFLKTDTTSLGTWKGTYGANGYAVADDSANYPSYAQVNINGHYPATWAASTADLRALQKSAASDRIASTWASWSSFTIDVNLTDSRSHQVALYCLDWDHINRSQLIEVLDASSGTILDSQIISSFTNGQYLVWNLTGHVTFRITTLTGNAVVSGVFLGGASVLQRP